MGVRWGLTTLEPDVEVPLMATVPLSSGGTGKRSDDIQQSLNVVSR